MVYFDFPREAARAPLPSGWMLPLASSVPVTDPRTGALTTTRSSSLRGVLRSLSSAPSGLRRHPRASTPRCGLDSGSRQRVSPPTSRWPSSLRPSGHPRGSTCTPPVAISRRGQWRDAAPEATLPPLHSIPQRALPMRRFLAAFSLVSLFSATACKSLDQRGLDACANRCRNISGNGGAFCGGSSDKSDCESACASGADSACLAEWDNYQICEDTSNPVPTACAAVVADFGNCPAETKAYETCRAAASKVCGTTDGPTCLCSPQEVIPCPCPSDGVSNCLAVGACTGTQMCSQDRLSFGACACSAGRNDAGIDAAPDAGSPPLPPDAQGGLSQCPGYAAPSEQAVCSCSPATITPCSANGCYNGYYCRLSDQTCEPKPAGC